MTDRDEAAARIVFGDERGPKLDKYEFGAGNVVTGNLVVNCGKMLQVRNNALSGEGAGYDTQLLNTRIEGNTFVAGPLTEVGIQIVENMRGRRHEGSVFRENVIYGTTANMSNAPGVVFAGNGWTFQPPVTMRGAGDVVGDLGLTDPTPPVDVLERDNYRPRPDSPLLYEGGYIGALPPAALPEPPPDVDPPPVDPPVDPPTGWRMQLTANQRGLLKQSRRAVREGTAKAQDKLINAMAVILDGKEKQNHDE